MQVRKVCRVVSWRLQNPTIKAFNFWLCDRQRFAGVDPNPAGIDICQLKDQSTRDLKVARIKFRAFGELRMNQRCRAHMEKLKLGDVVPRPATAPSGKGFSLELRKHVAALGPAPRKSLEVFVDLGLSDGEMARYFKVPETCISKLCHIWGIR